MPASRRGACRWVRSAACWSPPRSSGVRRWPGALDHRARAALAAVAGGGLLLALASSLPGGDAVVRAARRARARRRPAAGRAEVADAVRAGEALLSVRPPTVEVAVPAWPPPDPRGARLAGSPGRGGRGRAAAAAARCGRHRCADAHAGAVPGRLAPVAAQVIAGHGATRRPCRSSPTGAFGWAPDGVRRGPGAASGADERLWSTTGCGVRDRRLRGRGPARPARSRAHWIRPGRAGPAGSPRRRSAGCWWSRARPGTVPDWPGSTAAYDGRTSRCTGSPDRSRPPPVGRPHRRVAARRRRRAGRLALVSLVVVAAWRLRRDRRRTVAGPARCYARESQSSRRKRRGQVALGARAARRRAGRCRVRRVGRGARPTLPRPATTRPAARSSTTATAESTPTGASVQLRHSGTA